MCRLSTSRQVIKSQRSSNQYLLFGGLSPRRYQEFLCRSIQGRKIRTLYPPASSGNQSSLGLHLEDLRRDDLTLDRHRPDPGSGTKRHSLPSAQNKFWRRFPGSCLVQLRYFSPGATLPWAADWNRLSPPSG